MIVLAGFRPLGFDADSIGYFNIMENIINDNFDTIEVSFIYIVKIFFNLFGMDIYQRAVFVFYAVLNLFILSKVLNRTTNYFFISLLVYFFIFFPILSMTQMRFSLGTAIFLFSIKDIQERNFFNYTLKIFFAFLFHYTFALFILFYFLNPTKNSMSYFNFILFISFLFSFLKEKIVNLILYISHLLNVPEYFQNKIYINLVQNLEVNSLNILNIKIIFALFILYLSNKYVKNENLLYNKILTIGIILYFLTSFSPTIAFRAYNSLCIVLILIIPSIVAKIKEQSLSLGFLLLFLYLMFLNTMVRNSLFDWSIL